MRILSFLDVAAVAFVLALMLAMMLVCCTGV